MKMIFVPSLKSWVFGVWPHCKCLSSCWGGSSARWQTPSVCTRGPQILADLNDGCKWRSGVTVGGGGCDQSGSLDPLEMDLVLLQLIHISITSNGFFSFMITFR